MNIEKEYRAIRAKNPEYPARQCLLMARAKFKESTRKIPRYVGDDVTIQLPRGEYITIALKYDDDADIKERLQFETTPARHDHDAINHASDGWMARDGRILFQTDRYGEWGWYSDNYGFKQFWDDGKRNNSRHAAWLRARDCVAKSFDFMREALEVGYVGYVVTLNDANGKELDFESCWGFENIGDYCANEALDIAEHMQAKRAAHWAQHDIETREKMRKLREDVADAIVSLRNAREKLPDKLQRIFNEHLRTIRAKHSALAGSLRND